MNLREALALAPICVLCLWIGVRPQPLIDVIKPDVEAVAALYAESEMQVAANVAHANRRQVNDTWTRPSNN